METEMEDAEIYTFTGDEIDPDYEFDAARYFDFCTGESFTESTRAEIWFESLRGYPPSPFAIRLQLGEDYLLQNVTTSPKTKMSETNVAPEIDSGNAEERRNSAMDTSNSDQEFINITHSTSLQSSAQPNLYRTGAIQNCAHLYKAGAIPAGLTFYNHMNESKTRRNANARPFVSRVSTLMKPTASQLAKQSRSGHTDNFRSMRSEDKNKSLNNTPALENQAAKRQKLEGGHLRKVADTYQQTYLVHKERKRDANIEAKSTQAKLHITIPREPDLKTAHRARRMRTKVGEEREQATSTTHTFRALPLNRKILEAPSLLLAKRSTPQLPEFQEFHLKTSERAMQQAVPSYSVHCNNSKVSHEPDSGSYLECSTKDPRRQVEGCAVVNQFKATPFNKKVFSSKGDIGVFRSKKRETTVPKEFNFHTERRQQHDPPVDLFNRLTLESDLRSNVESHVKVPQSTLTFTKGSKENKFGSVQQESKVTNMLQGESQGIKTRQIPFEGATRTGNMRSVSRISGIR
ncbi:protein TPX2 isoform X3 [Daucus carota subsp. sativus]|uniref:TPX2 central domain-containing protein n=1 Tax=Daucus carota subsp. sativus TaxID=79200 RepID=A0A166FYH0_DAUCS|nr:PREDICTED: protein TPX2-like [Daucus carota subsp. sativus]